MTDERLPGATDVHVHLMPDRLMRAIRGALDEDAGWEFPHATDQESVEAHHREYDNAFLDTCFGMSTAVGDYVDFGPATVDDAVFEDLAGRIMYGSDYPNVPPPYRAEYEGLLARDLPAEARAALFSGAAERFLGER